MARLKSCSTCGRVHLSNVMCNAKMNIKKSRKDEAIYKSSKWNNVRFNVMNDYNNICLYTFYKEGRVIAANCVHHIVEIMNNETLAYEEDNLIPLSNEKHRLIHELYKKDKVKAQKELREMKARWKNGDRGLK